jgi:beta-glucosidase
MKPLFIAGFAAVLLLFATQAILADTAATYQYPFQDPSLPTEQRIDNLLSLMTIDEKIACLSTNTRVARLGIAGTGHAEGLHGLSMAGPRTAPPAGAPPPPPPTANATTPGAAGAAANPFRFRFPPILTTQFPQAYGMAETWDPSAIEAMGHTEGVESRYIAQSDQFVNPVAPFRRSSLIVMAPNADLGRDPRWGRTEECYGEDPFFNGTMVEAMVHGLQGDDPHYWLSAALLKHFLANSNEDTRESSSSDFDQRLFWEYYSAPFRMGIQDAGARGFMTSYNGVNGVPDAVNPIVRNIAVDEWGDNGVVCTDGGAMTDLVTKQKAFPDLEHAAAACLKAGITKYLDRYQQPVTQALKDGLITESDIDNAVRANFRVVIKLGLLDPPAMNPYSQIGAAGQPAPWDSDQTHALVRKVTDESIVLLKNQGGFLPLDSKKIKSIAVIGPRADEILPDWYGGLPPYSVTPLQGITARAGVGITVKTADGSDLAAAANLAKESDVAIVCVGNVPTGGYGPDGKQIAWGKVQFPSFGREAVDRQSITLEQEEIVKAVYAANPKTVVVLISSFPYAIDWSEANVPAILHMTQCSQEMGNSLADVLFGDYDPAGRLVQTWPASMADLPAFMDFNIRDGRTYMYAKAKPLYPFGFGLSYTRFKYSHLSAPATLNTNDQITVSADIKNTGRRAGDEVVQMYVKYLDSKVSRPQEQLVGFQRISLKPGESQTVTMPLKASQLAYWDESKQTWVVESGRVQVLVGASSADLRLATTVNVVAMPPAMASR